MSASKGSSFEREICKQLSTWWSKGIEGAARDDVFWRSSQSGGRATQRAKFGKRTSGSYGDINAVDPIGQPLLRYFTFELKRGRSHGLPADLIDCKPTKKVRPFEKALVQALTAAELAGSFTWALICKPDRREVMIYLPTIHARQFIVRRPPVVYSLLVNPAETRYVFAGWPFRTFLKLVKPADIAKAVKTPL